MRLLFRPLPMNRILAALETCGAISVPLLPESLRRKLVAEAKTYRSTRATRVVGTYAVRQEFSHFHDIPADSLFRAVARRLERRLNEALARRVPSPLESALAFNELALLYYRPGPLGISLHRDGKWARNLLCILNVCGRARFTLCDDREGSNPRVLATTPGNLILLRACGFRGTNRRPLHCVRDTRTPRISFVMAQSNDRPPVP